MLKVKRLCYKRNIQGNMSKVLTKSLSEPSIHGEREKGFAQPRKEKSGPFKPGEASETDSPTTTPSLKQREESCKISDQPTLVEKQTIVQEIGVTEKEQFCLQTNLHLKEVKSVGNFTRDSIKHPNKEAWRKKGKERNKITFFDNAGPDTEPMTESPGRRVLVTGGVGFLGQHVVSLLQTRVPDVHHISVLDLQPFSNLLDYKPVKPVRCYQGCITNTELLNEALAGIHTVYHIAGKISFGTFPDVKGMHWVNVKGTNCVIKACLANNVSRLIFCSTVDVVIGYDDIINGCEASVTTPKHFLFPGYPETKHLAEQEILKADGARTQNGGTLLTLSLRANVMYGEGDPYYVTSGLKNAQLAGGVLNQVGPGTARFQPVYVGNTAWAFTCADKALQENPKLGGQFYYVPDDTPVQNTFNFIKPFLEARGHQLSTFKLPFNLVYYGLLFAEWIAWFISPVYKISLPAESYSVRYINMDLFFSRKKAETELGFKPIFSPKKAFQMCLKYYRDLNL